MGGSLNKVMLIGNLGRDAELRYTQSGAAVCRFSLATTERWKDKSGQPQERTEWHRVDLWGKRAEGVAEYLTKGKAVYVEGKIQTRKWTDKEGNDRYSTEIRADDLVLLGSRGDGEGGGPERPRRAAPQDEAPQPESAAGTPLDDDDIPFMWLIPLVLPALTALSLLNT